MTAPCTPASDQLKHAAWLGVSLLVVTLILIALLAGSLFWINRNATNYELPLAVGVMAGFVMLVVALAGLVLIYNALGLADADSALGLPAGSIRALLALALVAVFIGVCSAELFGEYVGDTDSAKQILSIAATALTTIIGFYFGSNSANDAYNAANQTTSTTVSTNPTTLDDLSARAASIKGIADGMQQKLKAAAEPSADRIAEQSNDAAGVAALRDKFAFLTAQMTAAGVDRDRAANVVADATADVSKLTASVTTMQQYSTDVAKAQAEFEPALSSYITMRDGLLAAIAKG